MLLLLVCHWDASHCSSARHIHYRPRQSKKQGKKGKMGGRLGLTFRHTSHVWCPQGMLALEGRVAS